MGLLAFWAHTGPYMPRCKPPSCRTQLFRLVDHIVPGPVPPLWMLVAQARTEELLAEAGNDKEALLEQKRYLEEQAEVARCSERITEPLVG